MADLRLVAPTQTIDKITGRNCYKLPINIIEISDEMIARTVYGNSRLTECRDIVFEMCSGNGSIVRQQGMMWETTYQQSFVNLSQELPCTTMGIF